MIPRSLFRKLFAASFTFSFTHLGNALQTETLIILVLDISFLHLSSLLFSKSKELLLGTYCQVLTQRLSHSLGELLFTMWTYVIQPNESLREIASRFHTRVTALEAANPGMRFSLVKLGDAIHIPGRPSTQEYRIKIYDSLYSISKEFRTNIACLFALNKDIDSGRIMNAGQIIDVPEIDESQDSIWSQISHGSDSSRNELLPIGLQRAMEYSSHYMLPTISEKSLL